MCIVYQVLPDCPSLITPSISLRLFKIVKRIPYLYFKSFIMFLVKYINTNVYF